MMNALVTITGDAFLCGHPPAYVGMVPQIGLRPLPILSKLSFTDNFIIRRYTARTDDIVK